MIAPDLLSTLPVRSVSSLVYIGDEPLDAQNSQNGAEPIYEFK